MFETSGSLLSQQHSPLESSAFRSRMIAPANTRQPEILPASVNPFRVSPNSGFNDFGIPDWPENGFANDGIGSINNYMLYSPTVLYTPNQFSSGQLSTFPPKPCAYEAPCPEQRKFLVFDQCRNETRLMFSSLYPDVRNLPFSSTMCPGVQDLQVASAKPFDACKFLLERQTRKDEQVSNMPIICEESGENDFYDEEREMREDTEEINALLYSDDDDDDYNDEGDDEVSSGHSPLVREAVCSKHEQQESDFDDVAISSVSLKKRKVLDGASDKNHSGDFISALDEEVSTTTRSKRPRTEKIHDTLKVLESILPGLKNKDPVAILDEAISYLKCLKYNAVSMSADDSSSSGCYEPLH